MRISSLKIILTSLIYGFFLCGCSDALEIIKEGRTLSIVTTLSSETYTGVNMSVQPAFNFTFLGSLLTKSAYDISISTFTDNACRTAALGTFNVSTNPVPLTSGVATFSGVNYTNAGPLEQAIYLKASTSTDNINSCVGPIDILHRFNTGFGYSLFHPGGPGAAGALNGAKSDYIANTQIDSQGRYVIAGYTNNSVGRNELTIWRYNPNGSLDTTFGNGATTGLGYVLFQAGGNGAAGASNATKGERVYVFQIDSQGRFVLVGNSGNSAGTFEIVIWRYNPDGSLDSTFGNGTTAGLGYVLFQPGGLGVAGATNATKYDDVFHFQIDSQGRYVLAAYSYNPAGRSEAVILRYSTDGSLDSTFGNGATAGLGYVIFQSGGNGASGTNNTSKNDVPYRLKIDSQGRHVIVGISMNSAGGNEITIWRYNPNGSLDTTFGNGTTAGLGYVLFQPGGLGVAGATNATKYDDVFDFQIDSQGRYVLVGRGRNSAGRYELPIWRYNPDGSLDTTFGNGTTAGLGYVLFQPGGLGVAGATNATKYDYAGSIHIDSQGRYIVAGSSRNSVGRYEPVIWRYNSNGNLDTTFGNGTTAGLGYVLFQPGGLGVAGATNATKNDYAGSIQIDSRGRYIVAGAGRNPAGSYELVIWRYLPTGELDF